jgi:hypothetical protein
MVSSNYLGWKATAFVLPKSSVETGTEVTATKKALEVDDCGIVRLVEPLAGTRRNGLDQSRRFASVPLLGTDAFSLTKSSVAGVCPAGANI